MAPNDFREEVIERLTRIETNVDHMADVEDRIMKVERSHSWLWGCGSACMFLLMALEVYFNVIN